MQGAGEAACSRWRRRSADSTPPERRGDFLRALRHHGDHGADARADARMDYRQLHLALIFLINLPVGVLAFLLIARLVEDRRISPWPDTGA